MIAPIRVLVADDHTVVREGIAGVLRAGGYEVVGEAGDGAEAVELAVRLRPAVALLDLSMPRLSGLEATRRIRQDAPKVAVLVLTAHDEEEFILPLVRAGVQGYLRKDCAAAELVDAVRTLAAGGSHFGGVAARLLADHLRSGTAADDPFDRLTDREREVFHLAAEGRTTKQIAKVLGISPKTAENHRTRLLAKLELHGTAELVRYAARRGWIR